MRLRSGLIARLRLALDGWLADETAASDSPDAAAEAQREADAASLRQVLDDAELALPSANGVVPDLSPPLMRWISLVLGRESFMAADGRVKRWAPELLQRLHRAAHNCLALMWRARARGIGGVPALVHGRGRTEVRLEPYARFKRLSVR